MKKLILLALISLLTCSYYKTFDDLSINEKFQSSEIITVYVETRIATVEKVVDCWQLPWETLKEKTGTTIDKCLLWMYLYRESGLGECTLVYAYNPELGYYYYASGAMPDFNYGYVYPSSTRRSYNYRQAFQEISRRRCP